VKSDVYSFGVTMLETISGEKCVRAIGQKEEHLPSQVSTVIPNKCTTPVRSTCISNPENANFD
jgi:hypothetical protein